MFGDTEVWVVVIEWGDLDDIEIRVAPTETIARKAARVAVVEMMKQTVPEYNPDGCREFVLADSELDDAAWLAELHEIATVPWVTIEKHIVPINPVSR